MIDMFLEILLLILFIIILYLLYENREWKKRFEEKVRRSSLVLSGKTIEKLIPFLEDFPYDAHDMRWSGNPIDFIIFDGLSRGEPKQVVFCEVKFGKSDLTSMQRKIRELIKRKKVKWEEFRIK